MAEYEDGYEWWVIGHIDNAEEVNLSKWMPNPSKDNLMSQN